MITCYSPRQRMVGRRQMERCKVPRTESINGVGWHFLFFEEAGLLSVCGTCNVQHDNMGNGLKKWLAALSGRWKLHFKDLSACSGETVLSSLQDTGQALELGTCG